MKKIILLAIISASIMVLSASCSSGISQEQYKKANDDLAAAQTQVQSLQTQTQTLQTQTQALQTQIKTLSSAVPQEQYKKATDDLAAAQTQVQSLQAQVQTLQTQVQSLQSQTQASQGDKAALADLQKKISQTKPYWNLFTGFYQIGIAGQSPTAAQILSMMATIQATGDTTLTAKMQAVMNSNGGKTESLDFVNYLISKVSDLLK